MKNCFINFIDTKDKKSISFKLMRCFYATVKGYQEPPPPPPEPPPDDPPPDEPLPPLELLDDGFDDITLSADSIVEFINYPNYTISKALGLSYQDGACSDIDSNFLIHLSDTSNTYVKGNIS